MPHIHAARSLLFGGISVILRKEQSSLKAALMLFPEWFSTVNKIPVDDLKDVPEDEMKTQFKLFVNRLETLTQGYSIDELHNLYS